MSYRILTKNGVDNLNTDGARNYNFVTGGKSGIVDGILNNCAISIQSGNQIVINTGELRLSGHRVVIDEAETKTLLNIPANNRTIYLIAQISIDADRNVLFDLFFSETTATRKDNLSKVSSGIYQLELANFTQTKIGELINLKTTAPLLNMDFQEKLVSGNNIKTINGQSLLGSGNIITDSSGGNIIIDNQLSLESENAVQNKVITEALNEKVGLKGDEIIDGQKTFTNIPLVNTVVKLLDGYTPLTYVGVENPHNGYPYFETNMGLLVNYNETFSFHLKFKRSGDYPGPIFTTTSEFCMWYMGGNYFEIKYGVVKGINLQFNVDEIIAIDMTYKDGRLNYTISNNTETISDYIENGKIGHSNYTATLLRDGGSYAGIEFLELQETKDGVLAYHLIPAMRLSDNMAGFYDIVNNVFTANARGSMQGITYGEELKIIEKLATLSDIPKIPEIPQIEINNGQPTTETMTTFSFNGVNYALPIGGNEEGSGSGSNNLELLWENPSPTSSFPAQTITLSSNNYDYLIINPTLQTTIDGSTNSLILKKYPNKVVMSELTWINESLGISVRIVRISEDGLNVTFENVKTSNDNSILVPLSIYGVKNSLSSQSNENIYSTEETVVGKWIDGRPIYRKTIVLNNITIGSAPINHNISNLDIAIKVDVFMHETDTSKLYYGTTPIPNNIVGVQVVNNTSIKFYNNGDNFSGSETRTWYFILKYTKTTD